ncbi:MAG: hypothetical protein E6J68_05705 [Deltaproteobacteria bacterium]|nr:MAG: hypothetical protein E6J68_05705 [Deltaproteobacteria bacterium]
MLASLQSGRRRIPRDGREGHPPAYSRPTPPPPTSLRNVTPSRDARSGGLCYREPSQLPMQGFEQLRREVEMREYAEPRPRRLVAEHLGVDPEELRPEVSLIDELAVDSLELIELALALEGELGIDIPERTIDEIRTYGDLAGAALALARGSQDLEAAVGSAPATVRSRVVSGVGAALERAGTLTPYLVEEIVEDALAAGRAARLELTVPADTDDIGVAWLERQFIELATRGVEVTVRRNVPASPAQHSPHAA